VKVYNPFAVIIPAGKTIVVLPEAAGDYLLVGSDCITT
jgi:hypothetical protein